jgi:hypothetical protein
MPLEVVHKKDTVVPTEAEEFWKKVLEPKFKERDRKEAIRLFNLPDDYFDEEDTNTISQGPVVTEGA